MFQKFWQTLNLFVFLLLILLKVTFESASDSHLGRFSKDDYESRIDPYEWTEATPVLKDEYVADCQFVSSQDGWLVSTSGSILRWNGSNWERVQSVDIDSGWRGYRIDVLSPDNVWFVGKVSGGERSILLNWNGSGFQSFMVQAEAEFTELDDVSMLSDQLGFASGVTSKRTSLTFISERVIYQWNGKEWNQVSFPRSLLEENVRLSSMTLVSPSEGWASEVGSLFFWDGNEWLRYDEKLAPFSLFWVIHQFDFLSPANGWAVGQNNPQSEDGKPGIILHWDGKNWTKIATADKVLFALDMVSASEGWAVGKSSYGIKNEGNSNNSVLHWDGIQWNEVKIPTSASFDTICVYDHTLGWIFGGDSETSGDQTTYKSVWLHLEKTSPTVTLSPKLMPSRSPTVTIRNSVATDSKVKLPNPVSGTPTLSATVTLAFAGKGETGSYNFAILATILSIILLVVIFLTFQRKLRRP